MDAAIAQQWIALAILFVIANIWGEDNVRFGYILVPFMAGFFTWIKWISFAYLGTIIPIVIAMGVVTFLRSHLRFKYGVFGSGGSLIWKIVVFAMFLQFAIVFVNGLAIFNTNYADTPTDAETSGLYSISSANTVYGQQTYNLNPIDAISGGITILWTSYRVLWSLVLGFFTLYPSLIANFGISPSVAAIASAGVYFLTAFEVFALVFKPYGKPEV